MDTVKTSVPTVQHSRLFYPFNPDLSTLDTTDSVVTAKSACGNISI